MDVDNWMQLGERKGTGEAEFTCGCGLGLERGLASQRNASKCRRAGATAKGIKVGKGPVGWCLAYRCKEYKGYVYNMYINLYNTH